MTSTIHADKIMNSSGDQDSGLDLQTNDQVKLKTANTDRITVTDATTSISNDLNVDSGTLFVDASENKVGIKTTTPANYYADDLVVTAPDEGGITVVGGTAERNYLAFADGTSGDARYRGLISYDHNTDKLGIGAGGGTKIELDGNGNMTNASHPSFQAYYANNSYCWSDYTDGGSHLQTLNQTRFNKGNHYDTTNHRFIAPVAGVYSFYGQYYTNYSSNYARYGAFIYVNGVARSETWIASWEVAGSATTALTIELAANDYVQLYTAVYDGNATGNQYNVYCGAGYTYLNGHLVA